MSRYTTLLKSTEPLYAESSPIFIAASALLKDNETDSILLQLKFKNISDKIISAVKVFVKTFDVSGKELEAVEEYQYLDLSAEKNSAFGQDRAITMPDSNTRNYIVKCTEVIFNDNSFIDIDKDSDWEKLPEKIELSERFDVALCEQYQKDTFENAKYIVEDYKDLWICSCGNINKKDKRDCEVCGNNKEFLVSALDENLLKEHREVFEKEEAEKAEQLRVLKEKEKKERSIRNRKTAKWLMIIAIISIVCAIIGILIAKVFIPMSTYKKARNLMGEGDFEEAISVFESLEGFKDSNEQIIYCKNGILEIEYQSAISLLKQKRYEEAINVFESLENYRDSKEKIDYCENEILESKYQSALLLMNQKEYAKAEDEFRKIKNYKDSDIQVKECIYLRAVDYFNNEQYYEAEKIFEKIKSYKDSKEKSVEAEEKGFKKSIKNAAVGETIAIGEFAGKNINWRILCIESNRMLLISEKCITNKPYNEKDTKVTWKTSTIREWLNNYFIEQAFSEKEEKIICEVNISTPNNESSGKIISGGENTVDKMFLLSIEEAEKYLGDDLEVKSLGYMPFTTDDGMVSEWWLRNPGSDSNKASNVFFGWISTYGSIVTLNFVGVRPAMWIDLSAIE